LGNGSDHLCGPDMWWNWFDFAIVSVGLAEAILSYSGANSIGMSCLRILRFLRISKLLRMFRALRIVSELRLMIDMFVGSCVFFMWCSVMFALFLSLFAIFFVQGMTFHLQGEAEGVHDPKLMQDILGYFGSVRLTMLSLFMAVTGGNDWSTYHDVLKRTGPWYPLLWIFFILFSLIAFFNIIGGVFCEKAMALGSPTMYERMAEKRIRDQLGAAELSELLHSVVECGGSCRLTEPRFNAFLNVPEVAAYFEGRGFTTASAQRLFWLLLDAEQSNSVSFGKFISAVVKLDGSASSIDLHVLHVEMMKFRQDVQDQLDRIIEVSGSGGG